MNSNIDCTVTATCAELQTRCKKMCAGLDIGFADPEVSRYLRETHNGVWFTIEDDEETRTVLSAALDAESVLPLGEDGSLPFEDAQFDVVLLAQPVLECDPQLLNIIIRESHRVLKKGALLIFTVIENSNEGRQWSDKAVYDMLRNGFDVVGLTRPPWWKFGRSGHTLTVCAQRKSWRNRGAQLEGKIVSISNAVSSVPQI